MQVIESAFGIGNNSDWHMLLNFVQNGQFPNPWYNLAHKTSAVVKDLFHNCTCGQIYETGDSLRYQNCLEKLLDQTRYCYGFLIFGSVCSFLLIASIYRLRQDIKMQESMG
jgi:hypothetical protein